MKDMTEKQIKTLIALYNGDVKVWRETLTALKIEGELMKQFSEDITADHNSSLYNPRWKNVIRA